MLLVAQGVDDVKRTKTVSVLNKTPNDYTALPVQLSLRLVDFPPIVLTLVRASLMYSLRRMSGIPYNMPKRSSRTKRKPRNPQKSAPQDVGYSGPAIPRIMRDDNRIDREIFQQSIAATMTTAAVPLIFSSDIALSAPVGFPSYVVNYREYRTLAVKVFYTPGARYAEPQSAGSTSISADPCPVYSMREDLSPPSLSQFDLNPTSARNQSYNEPWTCEIKARGTQAMLWNSSGATLNLSQVMAIKTILPVASAVLELGRFRVVWLVEFRGRN